MKILISGGQGQLGKDCEKVLGQENSVFAFGKNEFDVTNLDQIQSVLQKIKPDLVINCAAFTKVDACEHESELAWQVNVEGVRSLVSLCREMDLKLIHISTDYVFDGSKPLSNIYIESDETNPLSIYGKSKLESEKIVKDSLSDYLIIRTSWLYGMDGANFLKTILRKAQEGKALKVVNDQYGSLTWTYRVAQQIKKLIQTNKTGLYHVSAEGVCTWFEAAEYFLKKMEIPCQVFPCLTSEYPTAALRPRNSILENQRLKKEGINLMQNWKEELDSFVKKFRETLISEAKNSL